MDYVERISLELPVPVSEVWALLGDFTGWGNYHQPTWAECLSKASRITGGDVIGELYLRGDARTEDFERVPTGRPLTVVMMPQGEGFILRWHDEQHAASYSILGGRGHSNLLRHDDDEGTTVKKGWMTVPDALHLRFSRWG